MDSRKQIREVGFRKPEKREVGLGNVVAAAPSPQLRVFPIAFLGPDEVVQARGPYEPLPARFKLEPVLGLCCHAFR
jgi:hypothetical protein